MKYGKVGWKTAISIRCTRLCELFGLKISPFRRISDVFFNRSINALISSYYLFVTKDLINENHKGKLRKLHLLFSGVIFNFNTVPVLTNQLTYFIFAIKRIYPYHLQNLTIYGTSYIYK